MDSTEGSGVTVEGLAEYCDTQAGLLLGTAETIAAELDDLLDEIDEETAAIRDRLDSGAGTPGPESPTTASVGTDIGDGDGTGAVDETAAIEALEEKQLIAETKQTRMHSFRELAAQYVDLAEELREDVDAGVTALDRVVQFEADADAPAYFDDRETVLEVALADRNEEPGSER